VQVSFGIAKRFTLGTAVLENVPVNVLQSKTGENDRITFGTRLLEQFYSTLDYPRNRLILSPKLNANLHREHMHMLPDDRVEVPFYMWGDHYMFAQGAIGSHQPVIYFVDSGLVALFRNRIDAPRRQAALRVSREQLREWGFREEDIENRVFESDLSVSMGDIQHSGMLIMPSHRSYGPFGGVEMHALLAHAFLKHHAWTIDFPRRKYTFSGNTE